MEGCHVCGRSCICVFVYLYLGSERVVVGEWIVDVLSFQKIFGLCGLKCHIVEIWRDVTFVDKAVFVYLYLGNEGVVVIRL